MADFNEEQLKRISFHLLTFKNPRARQHVLRNHVKISDFFLLEPRQLQLTGLFPEEIKAVRERNWAAAEKETSRLAANDIGIMFSDDEDYPPRLAEIYDPPDLIYVRGDRALLRKGKAGRGRVAARQLLRAVGAEPRPARLLPGGAGHRLGHGLRHRLHGPPRGLARERRHHRRQRRRPAASESARQLGPARARSSSTAPSSASFPWTSPPGPFSSPSATASSPGSRGRCWWWKPPCAAVR